MRRWGRHAVVMAILGGVVAADAVAVFARPAFVGRCRARAAAACGGTRRVLRRRFSRSVSAGLKLAVALTVGLASCGTDLDHRRAEYDRLCSAGPAARTAAHTGDHVYALETFVVDGMQPTDVRQGKVGFCWGLSAHAAMIAVHPIIVYAAFGFDEKAMAHAQAGGSLPMPERMALFDTEKNRLTMVPLENHVPADKNGKPLYAQCPDGECHVALFEQGFARHARGYQGIDHDWPGLGLWRLTGVKPFTLSPLPAEASIDLLRGRCRDLERYAKKGYPVLRSTLDEGNLGFGMINDHAYWQKSAEVVACNGRPMVSLYDPHGKDLGPIPLLLANGYTEETVIAPIDTQRAREIAARLLRFHAEFDR